MVKQAVIVVDIQKDYFPGGKWPLVNVEAAADKAAKVIAAARAAGDAVVHIRHEFPMEAAPFFAPGSEGAAIHPKAAPLPGEPVIVKNAVNAFLNTNLDATLKQAGIEAVTIVGAMSHMCVDAATRAAADLGYKVTVVEDACATTDLETGGRKVPAADVHAAFMAALGFAYAEVVDTAA
ncbi:MAG: cysteine hydrolase family protein, partial [Zavarzinia sp.]|nr:cysteine hydrolase family protein [Zavarzinia sp.]